MVASNLMCHVTYTTIVNSYIMHKAHKTQLDQQVDENNVTLEVQCGFGQGSHKKNVFYSKGDNSDKGFCTQSQRVAYFYAINKNIRTRRLCVVCKMKVNWFCPTCDDTMVCFYACFVTLHSKSTQIVCQFSVRMGPMP